VADRKPFDEPDGLDEALCPADARGDGTNLILDDDLAVWLEEIAASQITVVLDCCHAGSGVKDADDDFQVRALPRVDQPTRNREELAPWRDLKSTSKRPERRIQTAFFACRPEQQAFEHRTWRAGEQVYAGQFTHFFLEGLASPKADEDGDGVLTAEESCRYAARRLDATFNRTRTRDAERQQPVLESDRPDAPVFGVKRTVQKTVKKSSR
jgi:hypothetical protein